MPEATGTSIVIVGDSPATYICAIYLFTANIKPLVVRASLPLEYNCTFVPGLEVGKAEYTSRCCEQAKNMGIEVVEGKECSVKSEDGRYTVTYGTESVTADYLVLDSDMGQGKAERVFVVDQMVLEREAIEIAGVGCMIAFKIKDLLH